MDTIVTQVEIAEQVVKKNANFPLALKESGKGRCAPTEGRRYCVPLQRKVHTDAPSLHERMVGPYL